MYFSRFWPITCKLGVIHITAGPKQAVRFYIDFLLQFLGPSSKNEHLHLSRQAKGIKLPSRLNQLFPLYVSNRQIIQGVFFKLLRPTYPTCSQLRTVTPASHFYANQRHLFLVCPAPLERICCFAPGFSSPM